jgi:hypothetical protein
MLSVAASLWLVSMSPVSDALVPPFLFSSNEGKKTPSIALKRTIDVLSQDEVTKDADASMQRRRVVRSFLTSVAVCVVPQVARASTDETVTVPLRWVPQLQAYVLHYSIGGDRFGAILDTGSPFLTVPSYCDETKYGCYRPGSSTPSGLAPTFERFDNTEGEVEWRSAPFSFLDARGSMIGPSLMTFGVLSDSLMEGPGGVFFGLVKETDAWIRPSFLGQTNVRSFIIDLASISPSLTLTTMPVITGDYIPLVKDLNRRYGDPTIHYTARAKEIRVNGKKIGWEYEDGSTKPIYVIFDTGVTGMVVSRQLFDERYAVARKNRERSLWGSVEISFRTKQGKTVQLASQEKPMTTPMVDMPWRGFNAHLIVIGLSFLNGNKLSVDIDDAKLWIEQGAKSLS